jgi:hypothetical protein
MINERKLSDEKDEKMDLLSNLVDANEELLENGEQRLGDEELIGRGSGLGPSSHAFTHLTFRKHVHVLHGRTRGEDTPTNADNRPTPVA